MTRRFAGDIFQGVGSLQRPTDNSVLLSYFPNLYNLNKPRKEIDPTAAKKTGGFAGVPQFGGAKLMQRHEETGSPVFGGPQSAYK
jgi:hypothetical protein